METVKTAKFWKQGNDKRWYIETGKTMYCYYMTGNAWNAPKSWGTAKWEGGKPSAEVIAQWKELTSNTTRNYLGLAAGKHSAGSDEEARETQPRDWSNVVNCAVMES